MNRAKRIVNKLNPFLQCKQYDLALWQCPQFLFVMLGCINIVGCLLAYLFGSQYIEDPRLVVLLILWWAGVLFVLSYLFVRNLEDFFRVQMLREEFIEVMSHHLRAPITNIKWTLNYIQKKEYNNPKEFESFVDILEENIQRMENLINNLVVLNKMRDTKLFRKTEKINLSDFIQKIIKNFQDFARAHNITIHLIVPKAIVLSLPKEPLRILLKNLIENAIKYNKGGGKVTIEVRKKKNKIYLTIQDTGIGIAQRDQTLIFEKFFRGKNAFQKDPHGSGLGLCIVKEIVKNLKGKIKFKSQLDKGTTFYLIIPSQLT